MAESTLSIAFTELKAAVGFFLGYGLASDWDSAQSAEIEIYVQAGVRQVYYPPAVDNVEQGFQWSWLSPETTLTTVGPYSTGTITVSSGVVTLTAGVFPSWAAKGTMTISSTDYTVNTRDSNTQDTLTDTSLNVGSASTYSLTHPPTVSMEDDHGRILGDLTYEPDQNNQPIVLVSQAQIARFASGSDHSGYPRYAAEREKSSDGSGGQRKELVLWPAPDASYVLSYRYEAYQGKLSGSNPYPLGGMKYSELYTESCLAIAEQRAIDEKGIHTEAFQRMLSSMVEQDRRAGARHYGSMKGASESLLSERDRHAERYDGRSRYNVTYDGATW